MRAMATAVAGASGASIVGGPLRLHMPLRGPVNSADRGETPDSQGGRASSRCDSTRARYARDVTRARAYVRPRAERLYADTRAQTPQMRVELGCSGFRSPAGHDE